jgi:outer membrane protein TolC
MTKNFVFRAVFTLVCVSAIFAETAEDVTTLSVDDAVKYALSNSYQLRSAAIDLAIKERAGKTAWNPLMPSVQATATLNRANSNGTVESAINQAGAMSQLNGTLSTLLGRPYTPPDLGSPGESDRWTAVAPAVTATWAFNPAILYAMKAANSDYEAGKITWEQTRAQAETNVRKMFYGLLIAKESLEIQEESLEASRLRMEQARTNYQNGRAAEIHYLQAQVAYEAAKPNVLKAQQQIEDSLGLFALLIGFDEGKKIDISGEIIPEYKDLDTQNLIQQNMGRRFDMRTLERSKETLAINKKALDMQTFIPSVQISWQYQLLRSLSDKEWYSSQVANDWGGSLSFTLAWNLTDMLPWSGGRQNAKTIGDNMTKLDIQTQQAKANAVNEITRLVNNLELSQSQIDMMQTGVEVAQKAYDQTVRTYNQGGVEFLDVRDAQNSLNQAKLGLLNEEYNYISGLLDLELALNTKL